MKKRELLKALRETAKADRILLPGKGKRKSRAWPICQTCGREPYAVNLEDVGHNRVQVRVKCGHKPYASMAPNDTVFEDAAEIVIPFGADRDEHIGWSLKHIRWFDPAEVKK